MEANVFLPTDISLRTYRLLPPKTRKSINPDITYKVLFQKTKYFSILTYTQKCHLNIGKLAPVLKKRVQKMGLRLSVGVIRAILQSEEKYYRMLYLAYEEQAA